MVDDINNEAVESILIADDNPENLKLLRDILKQCNYKVRVAVNGEQAYNSINASAPDLALLDIHMPELDGYELCEKLKKNIDHADIPVIFISALSESFHKLKGFELGAVDYIVKPFDPEEVKARVKMHLKMRKQMREIKSYNKSMVDRELRIIELKKEVNHLKQEAGEEPAYPNIWDT